MPVTNGTSSVGVQQLASGLPGGTGQIFIQFNAQPLPPARRVGFLYVYSWQSASPFRTFLVDIRPLYAPGMNLRYDPNYWNFSQNLRVDADWDFNGLSWTATW